MKRDLSSWSQLSGQKAEERHWPQLLEWTEILANLGWGVPPYGLVYHLDCRLSVCRTIPALLSCDFFWVLFVSFWFYLAFPLRGPYMFELHVGIPRRYTHPQCWLVVMEIQSPNLESLGGSWGNSWSIPPLLWETHYICFLIFWEKQKNSKSWMFFGISKKTERIQEDGRSGTLSSVSTTGLKSQNYSWRKMKLTWFPKLAELSPNSTLSSITRTQGH